MGQYYLLANKDKREYILPHHLGCGSKLFEICANDFPRVLPYLLHQSSGHGGGDPCNQQTDHLGRWAEDRIVVIGEYDDSNLYQTVESAYTEISDEIRPEVNEFLPPRRQLEDSIYGCHGPDELLSE